MSVLEHPAFDNHENLAFFFDEITQLKVIIAIHNTTLGPAVGGCRMWSYDSETQAIGDVLRLSKGMTYKNAMANLPFGGGKAVIMSQQHLGTRENIFRAFGRMVHQLNGRYYSAEDIGTNTSDIMHALKETPYLFGLEGKSGDPSPITAHGVFLGIKAALQHQRQDDNLDNIRVAVQGVGHVGYYLCESLYQAGAKLYVSDINQKSVERVVQAFNATAVAPETIFAQDVDVFAPCALGGIINDQTIDALKATIIAGSANNQLETSEHGEYLHQRNILYAPDYVINAGGIINVSFEKNYHKATALKQVAGIGTQLTKIFTQSQKKNINTAYVADMMAQDLIYQAQQRQREQPKK